MRRFWVFFLVVCIGMSMVIPAFAAENFNQTGSKEIEVTAKYASSIDTPNVYSVDIEWSSMVFTYTQSSTKKWNAEDHSYATVSEGAWDKTSATITVTNHSNISVNVDMKYTAEENTGVKGTLTNNTAVLDAGEEGNYSGADSVSATLSISGIPSDSVTAEGVKIGAIKVTIN